MSASLSSPHPLLSDPVFPRLKDHVIGLTGLAYYADKDTELASRIARRLATLDLRECSSILTLLQDGQRGEAELDALIQELTIGETFFFRHQELFDALRDTVLPERIQQKRESRQLRIWSAGCSTGAEPYSVALLLKRDLAQSLVGWQITILGTDINRQFLAQAQEGRFEEWTLRATPEEVKRTCFSRSGNSWVLLPEYRQGVSFQYHNLIAHSFPSMLNNLSAFDIILCRNVTIYFAQEIVRTLSHQFYQSLVDGGWLLVGHAEPSMDLYRCFRTVNVPGGVLYQKANGSPDLSAWSPCALPEERFSSPRWDAVAPQISAFSLSGSKATTQTLISPKKGARGGVPQQASRPAHPIPAAVRSYADRGEWEKALACCQEILDTDRLNPVVHFYQALVLEHRGAHEEAERALRRAIYLDRHFVLAHYYLGLLVQRKGQRQQAMRLFQNVLRLLSRFDGEYSFAEGDGITAGDLAKLTQMHLEVLEGA